MQLYVLLQVQLTLYLGLVVAALSSSQTNFDKKSDDDDNGYNIVPVTIGLIMGLLVICLSLVCEIPVAVAQYKSSKIMNHRRFRILVYDNVYSSNLVTLIFYRT